MTFKTMLAGKVDAAKLKFPLLASPKLDGVRVHIIDGVAVSRNLLPFRNPAIQERFGRKEYNGLDGEFMVGDPTHPEAFRQTGLLNALSGNVDDVKLFAFDDFTQPELIFAHRLGGVAIRAKQSAKSRRDIVAVPHDLIPSHDDLERYEATCLEHGYEGVMVRDPRGPYKYGRSTTNEGWLLKLKRFEDDEAVIIDAEERMHNANEKTLVRNGKAVRNTRQEGKVATGVLGAVRVRNIRTGVIFNVGSGFDDAERHALWQEHLNGTLAGKTIKYQYFPSGSKDKPRFPTFKGFRDRSDI